MEPRDTFITERLVLRRPALTDTLGGVRVRQRFGSYAVHGLGDPTERT